MSLAVALLTLAVAAGVHVSVTSPTPTTPKSRRVMGDYPGIVFVAVIILKYACWFHAFVELSIVAAATISRSFSHSSAIQRAAEDYLTLCSLNNNAAMASRIGTPLPRLIGGLAVVLGSTIRSLCYRELGRHFTYHVALLKDHALVTTGPYSLVRHPAYTGGNCVQLGLLVWHAARGSWLRESGLYARAGAWVVLIPALGAVGCILGMYARRPAVEDGLLRKEFGERWEEWARAVKWRLVPGVY